jgi:hypothetical protein
LPKGIIDDNELGEEFLNNGVISKIAVAFNCVNKEDN